MNRSDWDVMFDMARGYLSKVYAKSSLGSDYSEELQKAISILIKLKDEPRI